MNENSEPLPDSVRQDNTRTHTAPRIWPALVAPLAAVVLAIAIQVVVVVVIAGVLLARGVDQSELQDHLLESMSSPGVFLLMLAGGQAAFGCIALLAAYLSPEPMRQRFGFNSVRQPVKVYGLTMLGSILPLVVALAGVYLLAKVIAPDPTFEKMFEKMTPLWGLAFVVLVAFSPGFIEEMLFRGYIQQRLLKRWSPIWAIGVTSLLFALVHITPHGIAVALPLGIWLGVIAWRTGSIGPSIACHAFVNGGLNTWRLAIKFGELSETVQMACHVIFVLIGTICFAMSCRLLAIYVSHPEDSAIETSAVI